MSVLSVTRISASIVTFNPDIDRLKENLDAISSQVHAVYLVDNGSENADEIASLVKGYDKLVLTPSRGSGRGRFLLEGGRRARTGGRLTLRAQVVAHS